MKLWVVGGVTAALFSLAGCGGDDPASDEDSVRDRAQEQADRYSAGDIGGAWDMWSTDSQDAVARDDYIAFIDACQDTGLPLEVSDVRIDEPGEATIRLGFGEFDFAYKMIFEDAEWRWVASEETVEVLSDGFSESDC